VGLVTAAVVALALALGGSVAALFLVSRRIVDLSDDLSDAILAKSLLGDALAETNAMKLEAERKRDEADARSAISEARAKQAIDRLALVEAQRNASIAREVEIVRTETLDAADPVDVLNRELREPILP
jgi:hypothetical protein